MADRICFTVRSRSSTAPSTRRAAPSGPVRISPAAPGRRGQTDDQLIVDVGEHLDRGLVGEVEAADHLVTNQDRHAQERAHRRVVGREAVAVRVLAQVGQPQGLGVDDEQPQDAVALGQVTDGGMSLLVDADRDELRQPRSFVVEDSQRAVASVDEVDGGLHDALQHGGQVEVAAHREHGVEKLAEAAGTCEPADASFRLSRCRGDLRRNAG
jgi:hypothetical protein